MAESEKIDDSMFDELFAALGDVSTTDDFVAATIERIGVEAAAEDGGAADDGALRDAQPAGERFEAVAGGAQGKSARRVKWRAVRVAALAACLALALGGGVAYAVPTSHVTVSQGDDEIELDVNRFGTVVAAQASNEAAEVAIAELDLVFQPFEVSVQRAADALGGQDRGEPVDIRVESGSEAQRERLESQSEPYRRARQGDDPRRDEPQEDAPRGIAPQGDTPQGAAPREDAPQGDTPQGSAPQGGAPQDDAPDAAGSPGEGGGQGQADGDGAYSPDAPEKDRLEDDPGTAAGSRAGSQGQDEAQGQQPAPGNAQVEGGSRDSGQDRDAGPDRDRNPGQDRGPNQEPNQAEGPGPGPDQNQGKGRGGQGAD